MNVHENEQIALALKNVFQEVKRLLSEHDWKESTGRNPKGDLQRRFDVETDKLVRLRLKEIFRSGIILSEELGDERFGAAEPELLFVIDPVDGSENFARNLPPSALCMAVLKPDAPLDPAHVDVSLVGDLSAREPFVGIRHIGAWQGDKRLQVSNTKLLEEAVLSFELNHWHAPGALSSIFARCSAVRCYGCASLAIAFVACGRTDAHIDLRDRLTVESYLAASHLVLEAGGHVAGPDGEPLPPAPTLNTRTSIIAAATRELAQLIVELMHSRN